MPVLLIMASEDGLEDGANGADSVGVSIVKASGIASAIVKGRKEDLGIEAS